MLFSDAFVKPAMTAVKVVLSEWIMALTERWGALVRTVIRAASKLDHGNLFEALSIPRKVRNYRTAGGRS